jgi:predicted MFS family arabinose efflux permease
MERPEPQGSGRFALLADRSLRSFFAAQAVSLLGDGMVPVALAFAVLGLGGSPTELGLVLTAQMAPIVLLLPAGGVIADRRPRRDVLVAADCVRIVSQGVLAALLISGSPSIGTIAALAAVTGGASAFFEPAAQGLLPSLVDDARLGQANALRSINMSVGLVAGPVLAGALVALAEPGWAIAADAASFALSALLIVRLPRGAAADTGGDSLVRDLREGWREFASRTWVWASVASASASRALFAAFLVLGPVIAERQLGGASSWAAISACFGAGMFAGGALAFRVSPARPLLVAALGASVFALPLALLALAAPVPLIALASLITGAGLMLAEALWTTTLQRHIPPESISRVVAYDLVGSMALQPAGLAAWGPIAAALGLSPALWLAFGLQTVAALSLLAVRQVRRLPAGPDPIVAR